MQRQLAAGALLTLFVAALGWAGWRSASSRSARAVALAALAMMAGCIVGIFWSAIAYEGPADAVPPAFVLSTWVGIVGMLLVLLLLLVRLAGWLRSRLAPRR